MSKHKDIGPQDEAAGPTGREKLLSAALKLAAKSRNLSTIGVRELGREAGLNPNTFYRHFTDLDDLSMALIDQLGKELRVPLQALRRSIVSREENAVRTVELVFDFAKDHPDVFIVGVRELYGASPRVREALRRTIGEVAGDLAEDMRVMQITPGLDDKTARELAEVVAVQTFHSTLDYLEHPDQRSEILRRVVQFINALFVGAMAIQAGLPLATMVSTQKLKKPD
ncbi:TetR family transcriptional regulator [Stenotrophobium rhamnosiphilum]|uniref:TetR family transcriptional regulator n=1 Tax=Stenotrophobium rhamnosiphilum TaxID=2029166 RepID=A0A2T5MIL9_9GAMM|nr:TetR family transcriptional regulator [Stenotrophobium rhamnosiphilum]PTU32433.1 TetR family transcriptional regulator [Stenotrophobium rhamnosiphilum]